MTISEIAKLAEVSSAAVSRYLNGGSLSEEKRNRIKAVIEETGYVPSEYARTLRTKKTYHVGVIVPNIKSSTTARIPRLWKNSSSRSVTRRTITFGCKTGISGPLSGQTCGEIKSGR